MVLILSDEYDLSTNLVIDYLIAHNISFKRINNANKLGIKYIQLSNDNISFVITYTSMSKTIEIDSKNITSFWYRRGWFVLDKNKIVSKSIEVNKSIETYLNLENNDIIQFLYKYLKNIKHIGYFNDNYTNKMYNLMLAKNVGLSIPKSIITTNSKTILSFLHHTEKIITKAIKNGGFSINSKVSLGAFTNLINKNKIEEKPKEFAPSLVQEYIEKKLELRVFYLNGKCYTAAIFSQADEQTKVDFRRYNKECPNRVVPFNLPIGIEEKIERFMNKLDYKSGSLDLIYTKENKYVFLEVNPVGQYDAISKKCNFNLDKQIAKYLS